MAYIQIKTPRKLLGDRDEKSPRYNPSETNLREEPSPKDALKAKRKKKLQKQSRKKNRR